MLRESIDIIFSKATTLILSDSVVADSNLKLLDCFFRAVVSGAVTPVDLSRLVANAGVVVWYG